MMAARPVAGEGGHIMETRTVTVDLAKDVFEALSTDGPTTARQRACRGRKRLPIVLGTGIASLFVLACDRTECRGG